MTAEGKFTATGGESEAFVIGIKITFALSVYFSFSRNNVKLPILPYFAIIKNASNTFSFQVWDTDLDMDPNPEVINLESKLSQL